MADIPENIFISVKNKITIKQYKTCIEFEAMPAFCVSENSKKLIASAKKWGTKNLGFSANAEMDYLTLIRKESRSSRYGGSSVYKVLTTGNLLVDLRETQMLEAIFDGRVSGDKVFGEWVWIQDGAQMKLMSRGTNEYNKIED